MGPPKSETHFRAEVLAGPVHVRQREEQAKALAELARKRLGPIILAGDLNATDQSGAYALLAGELRDAFRDAGFGFGHTFPGEPTSERGGSRPVVLGVPVPQWLVRIDYVFHSPELVTLSAAITASTRKSDHRGVVATLAFAE